jgi:hypothetical protein
MYFLRIEIYGKRCCTVILDTGKSPEDSDKE